MRWIDVSRITTSRALWRVELESPLVSHPNLDPCHQPPGRSVAVQFLPSPHQVMENGFPSVHFSVWSREKSHRAQIREYVRCSSIGMRLSGRNFLTERALWAGALSWCSIQTFFFQRFGRSFRKICRTVSVYTHHVCNHSHTQMSIFANNFIDILNVLVGFRSRRVTWMLIIFHFLPTLTKSFVPFKHMWTWR